MKQLVKAMLPAPVLSKAVDIRDQLRLVSVSKAPFDTSRLRSSKSLPLQHIFADPAIKAAWEHDHARINAAYGNEDSFGGVNPGDRRALYYLIYALKPQTVLEVGTHIGASTLHIIRALKTLGQGGHLTTADIIDVNAEAGPWKKHGLKKSPLAFAVELDCADALDFHVGPCVDFMKSTNARYDFIFLDGDHSSRAVYKEVSAALPLLNDNGVILLHDYYPNMDAMYPDGNTIAGPYRALERIKAENREISVLPLGELPWPTKQGTNMTTLALVAKS
jgi:predicted O-methyltransferase YrrM